MAAVASSGSTQPAPMQTDASASVPPLSWEGDKMFNIYIYDYCFKRGFRKTAKELMQEAEIPSDATPPINARQGLLFEWWSVFWVLFQAKSSGGGSDDGLAYIQHQQAQRSVNQRGGAAPLSLGSQPSQQPLQPPQQLQNMARLPNGMPPGGMQPGMTRPSSAYLANGQMTNGAQMNPAMGGQPQPGQQMLPGASMNFGGMGGTHPPPQPNGLPGPPVPGGPQQQQQQLPPGAPGGQSMQFAMMQGQRQPMMNGIPPQQQQQRLGPPNGAPFHGSPTMAHSPQHNAGTPGHPGQQQQPGQAQQGQPGQQHQGGPGQQAAMAQLGPSPHMAPMNRGMLPPNGGPPGMGAPGQQPQQPGGGPPTPGYPQQPNQAARPPSRTTTPRGMMPSPSLASRPTPGGGPPGMGPGQGPGSGGVPQQMGAGGGLGGMIPGGSNSDPVNNEIMQIPQNVLNGLMQELGYSKDISKLNNTEKNQIVGLSRSRGQQQRKDLQGQPRMMQAPGQQQQQRPGGGGPQQRIKRSSSSPEEEHETLPRNESSPPDRKRARRSPADPLSTYPPQQQQQPGPPPQGHPPHHQHHQQQQPQPGQPGGPPPGLGQMPNQQMGPHTQSPHTQMSSMMMRPQMMNVGGAGGPPPPPPNQQQQQGQQGQHLLPGGQPLMGMGMPPGPGRMFAGQQQLMDASRDNMYRMHQAQKGPVGPENMFHPGVLQGGPGPQFNSSPLNLNRKVPSMPNMMPPPSPAMGGPPKDSKEGILNKGPGGSNPQNGQQQQPQQGQQPSHNPDGSPRNQPPGGPSGSGTAPPTPVPSNQPNPQQQQPQQQPPPPPSHLGMMSSSSILGMPASGGMGGPGDLMFDPTGFINSMTDLGSEFDPATLFRPDGDINFERDFGQWFNPDESANGLGSGLDLKLSDESMR